MLTATSFAQKPDSTATPTPTKDTSYLKVNGKEIIIIEDRDAFDTKFEEWDNDKDFSKMNLSTLYLAVNRKMQILIKLKCPFYL